MKRILITGGAGFIGSHLAEHLLKKNNKITIIDNFSTGSLSNILEIKNKVEIIRADVSKIGTWGRSFKNKDIIFHLAALSDIVPSVENPNDYFNSNLIGTFNVLEMTRKYKIKKIIYAASSSCYGIPRKYPTNEQAEISPQYPYALTKNLGEQLVINWNRVYKIPAISLRLFNVYGPRVKNSNNYGAMFGIFMAQKLANKPFTVVGDGNQTRDFTYVTDVCRAFEVVSKNKNCVGKIYNIGSGKTISINKIVSLLRGKKIFIPKRPGEPQTTFADISKIKKDTKWRPKVNIYKGINLMLENIDLWKKAPIWDTKSIAKETKIWFKYLHE
jgi:UDP-glucose 4-epimerase